MNLQMDPDAGIGYKSPCQIARRVTEKWAADNLYCLVCESPSLVQSPANTRAVDFICDECRSAYQLKSMANWNERSIPDAGYDAMMTAIRSDKVPNLFVMHYTRDWRVQKLLAVPSFFFTASCIQKRKELSERARRAGWIGCNILLSQIAPEGKIRVVWDGLWADECAVRERYRIVEPLASLDVGLRGWTLDVLSLVRRLDRREFTLQELYQHDAVLAALHPNNRHVRPKMRQQLQVLRDLGLLEFAGNGRYLLLR